MTRIEVNRAARGGASDRTERDWATASNVVTVSTPARPESTFATVCNSSASLAQCIDACDLVMDRLSKPRGLIRFSSQSRIASENSRWLRPRVIFYPAILAVLLTAFVIVLMSKKSADITLLRGFGQPYTELTPGQITNQFRLKIKNRGQQEAQYRIEVIGEDPTQLTLTEDRMTVAAGQSRTETVLATSPRKAFHNGKHEVTLRISDGKDFSKMVSWRLLGPHN